MESNSNRKAIFGDDLSKINLTSDITKSNSANVKGAMDQFKTADSKKELHVFLRENKWNEELDKKVIGKIRNTNIRLLMKASDMSVGNNGEKVLNNLIFEVLEVGTKVDENFDIKVGDMVQMDLSYMAGHRFTKIMYGTRSQIAVDPYHVIVNYGSNYPESISIPDDFMPYEPK